MISAGEPEELNKRYAISQKHQ